MDTHERSIFRTISPLAPLGRLCEPKQDEAPFTTLTVRRRGKRYHRKSRGGCLTCKRRKVKCDEARPLCNRCAKFGVPCSYADQNKYLEATDAPLAITEAQVPITMQAASLPRRRGRPRKDWTATLGLCLASMLPPGPLDFGPIPDTTLPQGVQNIWVKSQAELFYHFTRYTSPTLVDTVNPNHPVVQFWQNNSIRLGLSHPHLLHLIMSLAGFHLSHLHTKSGNKGKQYLALAQAHLSMGITELNQVLPTVNKADCGGVLVSSILIFFCTAATGPTGAKDLFLCEIGSVNHRGMASLVQGTRRITELFEPSSLYTGLTVPLTPAIAGSLDDPRPTCDCKGTARVDWVGPLDELRRLITSDQSQNSSTYFHAFNIVAAIYEALYGSEKGIIRCPTYFKVVPIFLYLIDDKYLACLRNGETLAMLIISYYAPLLELGDIGWHFQGWANHILHSIQTKIQDEYTHLLDWPIEMVRQRLTSL